MALDYCVGSTALDSQAAGFETTIIQEGTKGIAPNTIEEMSEKLKAAGVKYSPLKEHF